MVFSTGDSIDLVIYMSKNANFGTWLSISILEDLLDELGISLSSSFPPNKSLHFKIQFLTMRHQFIGQKTHQICDKFDKCAQILSQSDGSDCRKWQNVVTLFLIWSERWNREATSPQKSCWWKSHSFELNHTSLLSYPDFGLKFLLIL